jgi:hypothetical protein
MPTYNLDFLNAFQGAIELFKVDFIDYLDRLDLESYGGVYGEGSFMFTNKAITLMNFLLANKERNEIMDRYLRIDDVPKNISPTEAFCSAWFMVECLHPLLAVEFHKDKEYRYLSSLFTALLELCMYLYNISDDYSRMYNTEFAYYEKSFDGIVRTLGEATIEWGNKDFVVRDYTIGGIGELN